MDHLLTVEIARDFDVSLAIFIRNIAFWTEQNLANNRNIRGGFCWVYNTLEAFADLFPYWTPKNIEYILNKAVNEGLLVKARLADRKNNRTCWYAMTPNAYKYYPNLCNDKYIQRLIDSRERDKELCDNDGKLLSGLISQNWEIHFPNLGNPFPKIGKSSIADNKPDNKPDKKELDNNLYSKSYEAKGERLSKISSCNNAIPTYHPSPTPTKPSPLLEEYMNRKYKQENNRDDFNEAEKNQKSDTETFKKCAENY